MSVPLRQAAVGVAKAGAVTSIPHGRTSLLLAARLVSSAVVMADLRLVRPVTTASGNEAGRGVGVIATVGSGVAAGVAVGATAIAVGDGVGVGLTQPATSIPTVISAAAARNRATPIAIMLSRSRSRVPE